MIRFFEGNYLASLSDVAQESRNSTQVSCSLSRACNGVLIDISTMLQQQLGNRLSSVTTAKTPTWSSWESGAALTMWTYGRTA